MKKLLIIAIFFLITVFGIGSIQGAETDASFAIYLSETDARSERPLSKMELSKVPFLTDADIIEYRWSKHEIKLSPRLGPGDVVQSFHFPLCKSFDNLEQRPHNFDGLEEGRRIRQRA